MKYKKLHPDAITPSKERRSDIGWDLYALEDYILCPLSGAKIRTGIALEIPTGQGGLIWDKSSMAWKKETGRYIKVCGGAIDPEYRGEIFVVLFNMGMNTFHIKKGEQIAQLIIIDVVLDEFEEIETLTETDRGTKGFGESSDERRL